MPKAFQSRCALELEAFMRFKQGLGQSYRRGADTLRSFDRYVAEHQHRRDPLDWPALVNGWLTRRSGRKANTVACELTVLRQFCLFRRRGDPDAFVPDGLWNAPATRTRFVPYDLSSAQVAELIRRTQNLQEVPLRRSAMRALLSILYCTGLRLGEALRLHCTDVDLKACCFFVRMSKGRSRWVPFGAALRRLLEQYLNERRRYVPESPVSPLLCRANGSAYSVPKASDTIRKLMRQAGFKPAQGRSGPRPYDLRHAYANERLRRWYQSGADLQRRLPDLSVYLGHQNLLGTEVYLKARGDLLRWASRRMAARFHKPQP